MTPEELPDLARYAAIPNSTSLTEIAERVAMMTGQQLHAHPWDEELWRRKNQTIRLLVAEVERLRGVVEAAATMMRERDAFMASYRSDSPGYDTSLGALRAALAALEAKE